MLAPITPKGKKFRKIVAVSAPPLHYCGQVGGREERKGGRERRRKGRKKGREGKRRGGRKEERERRRKEGTRRKRGKEGRFLLPASNKKTQQGT